MKIRRLSNKQKRRHKHADEDTAEYDDEKDAIIFGLLAETRQLKTLLIDVAGKVDNGRDFDTTYAASRIASQSVGFGEIPQRGMSAKHVASIIEDFHLCDFNPKLNTSSYVNITNEAEEREVAAIGSEINIADASVYPGSIELHDKTVNMIARLWHAPEPTDGENYCGAGTVGSTEACLLAGLALKFRWRKWYSEKYGLTNEEVLAIRPNLVISSAFQAAWEKLFRYFDIEAKIAKPNLLRDKMVVNAKDLVSLCDDKTIAVVGILGNHYNGNYDPIYDIDREVGMLNDEKGWQIGIHVDAASGGFICPFQDMIGKGIIKPFDFRLPNVLSISSSGHKFGESICGTGWIVFRQREDLAEHIAVTVTYLGGSSDSYTLNFSRPAAGPYVQFYKLLRLGKEGYVQKVDNQMKVAAYLREFIKSLKHPNGKNRFELLDGGDECCLPVVAARLHPELDLHYNAIDMQHALSESHWYVSGYTLGFENPTTEEFENLFTDVDQNTTMFRIVVKSNITRSLAENLADKIEKVLLVLDSLDHGYESIQSKLFTLEEEKEEPNDAPGMNRRKSVFWSKSTMGTSDSDVGVSPKSLLGEQRRKSIMFTQNAC